MSDPSETDQPDPECTGLATTLEGLEEGLREQADLVREVRELRTSNRKLRLLLGIVAFVALFSGVAAAVAFIGLREARTAANEARNAAKVATVAADIARKQAAANLETLRVSCESSNEARANTIAVWETFTRIASPEATRTPEAQKKVDELLAFVHDTYKSRDCSALTAGGP